MNSYQAKNSLLVDQCTLLKKNHQPSLPDAINQNTDISISCYDNEIPDFVATNLVNLYNNFYSSLPHIAQYKNLNNLSAYVERIMGNVTSLLIFERTDNTITVLNEVITISGAEIDRFSQFIFHHYEKTSVIKFRAIDAKIATLSYPFQQYDYLENIVVDLPESSEKFLASLGKNLRRNLKRFRRKIEQDYPSFSFRMSLDDDVNGQDIHDVVALNRARMLNKKKTPSIGDDGAQILTAHAKRSGLLCVAMIENKICAGAIAFRTGENFFLKVIAHDPEYDTYGLGILCCAHMICECIERGGREFHFLWGRYDYKLALNGAPRSLNQIAVFRSRLDYLFHVRLLMSMWMHERKRAITSFFHQMEKSDNVKAQLLTRAVNSIRHT
jgi:hypothetical protein